MAVLLPGGAGYIGSHTAVELLNSGKEIVIIDNFSNSKAEVLEKIKKITGKDFKFYEMDYRDKEKLEKVFTENNIEETSTKELPKEYFNVKSSKKAYIEETAIIEIPEKLKKVK